MTANKLMVVAHPDDESLFGGAQLILEHDWKVVCVTNGNNSVRRSEFEEVMQVTNSQFEIWDFLDRLYIPLKEEQLKIELLRVTSEKKWDKIVTHNSIGEYGHLHHFQLHRIMSQIVDVMWTFDFGPTPLPEEVWEKKINLIRLYKSQKKICDGHIKNIRNEQIVVHKNIFFA